MKEQDEYLKQMVTLWRSGAPGSGLDYSARCVSYGKQRARLLHNLEVLRPAPKDAMQQSVICRLISNVSTKEMIGALHPEEAWETALWVCAGLQERLNVPFRWRWPFANGSLQEWEREFARYKRHVAAAHPTMVPSSYELLIERKQTYVEQVAEKDLAELDSMFSPWTSDTLVPLTAYLIRQQTNVGPFPLSIMPGYMFAMRDRLFEEFDLPLELREIGCSPKSASLEEWRAKHGASAQNRPSFAYDLVWGSKSESKTVNVTVGGDYVKLNEMFTK
jgi:hypothetical protein